MGTIEMSCCASDTSLKGFNSHSAPFMLLRLIFLFAQESLFLRRDIKINTATKMNTNHKFYNLIIKFYLRHDV